MLGIEINSTVDFTPKTPQPVAAVAWEHFETWKATYRSVYNDCFKRIAAVYDRFGNKLEISCSVLAAPVSNAELAKTLCEDAGWYGPCTLFVWHRDTAMTEIVSFENRHEDWN